MSLKNKINHSNPFLLWRIREMGFALLLLAGSSACSKHHDELADVPAERTVILYFSAENSIATFGNTDVNEIKQGASYLKEGQKMVLFFDYGGTSSIYLFDRHTPSSASPAYTFATNQDASDPHTLLTVLNWAKVHAPAMEYGMVFWSHADGWLLPFNTDYEASTPSSSAQSKALNGPSRKAQSFGIDDGYPRRFPTDMGTNMSIPDLAAALQNSGLNFRYVYFDACSMQGLEVAYDLRHATDYVIASPMSTPADGAYYIDQIQKGLFSADPADIARTYMDDVKSKTGNTYGTYGQGAVIAALKTELLDSLAHITALMLKRNGVGANYEYPTMDGVQAYCAYSPQIFYRPDYFDAAQAMRKLLSPADAEAWCQLFDQIVVYKDGTSYFYAFAPYNSGYFSLQEGYSGVNLFVPQKKYTDYANLCLYGDLNEAFRCTSWYKAAGWQDLGF